MSATHYRWLVGAKRLGLVTVTLLLMLPLLGQGSADAPDASPDQAPGGDVDQPTQPTEPARPKVYMLPIEGPITQLTQEALARMMGEATEAGAAAIVFDLDTPGGQVGAALDICDMVKAEPTHTVAWVNPAAYSAGSMISVACNEIVIADNARIGDSAPILIGPEGLQSIGETERAKIESPILAEFRDSAKRNGYPVALSEAMVTLGPPIYRVVNDAGEEAYVWEDELYKYDLDPPGPRRDRSDDRRDDDDGTDQGGASEDDRRSSGRETPGFPRQSTGAVTGITDAFPIGDGVEPPNPANAEEPEDGPAGGDSRTEADEPAESPSPAVDVAGDAGASDDGEAAGSELAPTSEGADEAAAATADRGVDAAAGAWRIDRQVLEAETLLTMLTDEAIEYGFARKEINSKAELLDHLGLAEAEIVRLEPNWSEELVSWLSSPFIRGILTIVLLMGLYSEMQAPGLGFAGAVALVAAAVLLGAPYLSGLAQAWEILVIAAGFVLLAVEIFVIPGFGVAGISGIVLILMGLVMTFVPAEPGPGVIPSLPGTWDAMGTGLATVVIATVVSMVGMVFLSRHFGSLPLFNKLVLREDQRVQTASEPTVTSAGVGGVAMGAGDDELGVSVGDEGRAHGSLRPIGRAEFNGRLVEVTTAGAWVEDGETVRVTNVRGSRIEVAPA